MLIKAVEKVKWDDNVWEKLFNLVDDFRKEFSLTIKDISKVSDSVYFNVGDYHIYFKSNLQGFWITLETNNSKEEFDKVFEYLFSNI